MDEKPAKQKQYASAGNPTIHAVLKSLYRFATEEQALAKLAQLKGHFVISKQAEAGEKSAIMWIKNYEITPEETAAGFAGNYAMLSVVKKAGKYTLAASKVASELKYHPARKRTAQKHPDWGHPILRDIKKKRVFATLDEAAHELTRLHEAFPEVSIPYDKGLMIIMYEKNEGAKSPVQKYKFEPKPVPEGGFLIAGARNIKPIKSKLPVGKSKEPEGYFSTMVTAKTKKKPAKPS